MLTHKSQRVDTKVFLIEQTDQSIRFLKGELIPPYRTPAAKDAPINHFRKDLIPLSSPFNEILISIARTTFSEKFSQTLSAIR